MRMRRCRFGEKRSSLKCDVLAQPFYAAKTLGFSALTEPI